MALGLATVAIHRIVKARRGRVLEMHGLPRERSEARCDEHEPG